MLSFPNVNRRGGVERVVCETANYLAGRGHQVGILTGLVEDGALDRSVAVHTVLESRNEPIGLAGFARLAPFAYSTLRTQYDHHGAFCTASPNGGVLWVQAVHKRWIEISRRTRGIVGRIRQLLNPFHRVALRLEHDTFVGRRYSKLIALTQDVANDLIRFYSVPASDIFILPNGVSATEFRPLQFTERDRVRSELKLPLDKKVVLFVANEVDRKGLIPLLNAASALDDPRLHILAVGKLGNMNVWQRRLSRLRLSNQVTFTGPTSCVARFFAASDVFALPTIYEAWGLVIVEALASGLPVLTSRSAGAAEAIIEGGSGFLLDRPHDNAEIATKLRMLLDGRHMGAVDIAQSVSRYHWHRVLSEYEMVLHDSRASTY